MNKKIIPITNETEQVNPLNTICDLKWNYPIFNMERGEFRSCCRTPGVPISENDIEAKGIDAFLNSDRMIRSRLDLIKGVRNADCQSCWNLEDSGMKSPRHTNEQFWQYLISKSIVSEDIPYSQEKLLEEINKIDDVNHPLLKSDKPYMLEISLGNTCDMKCMYCSHHYSTQWATERIKYGEITQAQYDREFPKAPSKFNETFWEWFDSVKINLWRIGIIGGEPLITPEFYEFADKLISSVVKIQHKRKNKMCLWIVTNMNTPPNYLEKFFKYLPKLTLLFDVEILVSMESVGARAEYIRNGVDWDRFTSNIDKLLSRKELKFDFGFIISVNALSVPNLKDFVAFTEDLYIKYGKPVSLKHNIISFPDWQSPFILTPDFANYIDETVEYMKPKINQMPVTKDYYGRWDQYIIFLENLAQSIRDNKDDKTALRKKFVEWFNTYDSRRKLNLLETFPEFKNFYEMCENL